MNGKRRWAILKPKAEGDTFYRVFIDNKAIADIPSASILEAFKAVMLRIKFDTTYQPDITIIAGELNPLFEKPVDEVYDVAEAVLGPQNDPELEQQ